ncbi:hypothetical protein MKZ38_006185 [Zalerion maritima]|uniref:Uncharacterized protein n=1 Tax=Zalerion maritima TaxID=339359 RepID=A0AAD5WNV0_9PEZI|nr:hypothetical protein MKZ38_006185 [Zalerion maritima]
MSDPDPLPDEQPAAPRRFSHRLRQQRNTRYAGRRWPLPLAQLPCRILHPAADSDPSGPSHLITANTPEHPPSPDDPPGLIPGTEPPADPERFPHPIAGNTSERASLLNTPGSPSSSWSTCNSSYQSSPSESDQFESLESQSQSQSQSHQSDSPSHPSTCRLFLSVVSSLYPRTTTSLSTTLLLLLLVIPQLFPIFLAASSPDLGPNLVLTTLGTLDSLSTALGYLDRVSSFTAVTTSRVEILLDETRDLFEYGEADADAVQAARDSVIHGKLNDISHEVAREARLVAEMLPGHFKRSADRVRSYLLWTMGPVYQRDAMKQAAERSDGWWNAQAWSWQSLATLVSHAVRRLVNGTGAWLSVPPSSSSPAVPPLVRLAGRVITGASWSYVPGAVLVPNPSLFPIPTPPETREGFALAVEHLLFIVSKATGPITSSPYNNHLGSDAGSTVEHLVDLIEEWHRILETDLLYPVVRALLNSTCSWSECTIELPPPGHDSRPPTVAYPVFELCEGALYAGTDEDHDEQLEDAPGEGIARWRRYLPFAVGRRLPYPSRLDPLRYTRFKWTPIREEPVAAGLWTIQVPPRCGTAVMYARNPRLDPECRDGWALKSRVLEQQLGEVLHLQHLASHDYGLGLATPSGGENDQSIPVEPTELAAVLAWCRDIRQVVARLRVLEQKDWDKALWKPQGADLVPGALLGLYAGGEDATFRLGYLMETMVALLWHWASVV